MATNNDNRLKVTVTCDFTTDAASVFNAWLDPALLSRWMFGETVRDEKIIKLENDPREGGHFSYIVQRGEDVINHTGTYLEIQPYTRLVFTWGIATETEDESIVYVTIHPQDSGCHLSLVHEMDPRWEAYVSRTQEGWAYMLSKLDELTK